MADITSEYAAANGWREIDISSEEWRAYVYTDGSAMRIDDPMRVFIRADNDGETHRVIDGNGVCIRPMRGWRAIHWVSKPDQPAFVA